MIKEINYLSFCIRIANREIQAGSSSVSKSVTHLCYNYYFVENNIRRVNNYIFILQC